MPTHPDALRRARCGICTIAGAVVAIAAATPASAATLRWLNATGGFFNDTANWDLGAAPSASDDAIFDLNGAYTVDYQSPGDVGFLGVEAGDVEFNLAGQHQATGFVAIAGGAGHNARARFRDGQVISYFGMSVGLGAGAVGEVDFSGTAFGQMDNGETVRIGRAGDITSARLGVDSGARLDVTFMDMHGEALVTGAGSLLRAREANITGRMAFADGATSSTEVWNVTGELALTDASIVAENFFHAASLTMTRGAINASSSLGANLANVTITESASLTSSEISMTGGSLDLELTAQSFSASGPFFSAHRFGDIESNALTISFLDGYTPLAGEQIHLLSIEEDSTGAFRDPFSLVQATGLNHGWVVQLDVVSQNEVGGYDAFITFVPSPSTALVFVLGIPAVARRRRI